MSSRTSTDRLLGDTEISPDTEEDGAFTGVVNDHGADDIFGGPEERKTVEKALLHKLDLKLSFLLFISIMNYVSPLNSYTCRED